VNNRQETKKIVNYVDEMFSDIKNSKSKFHVISTLQKKLDSSDFIFLENEEDWMKLKSGGKYYFLHNRAMFSFVLPQNKIIKNMKIVTTHIDSPTFKIKHNGIIFSEGLVTLNTESYGGAILSSWLDRPISVAGRVYFKGEDSFKPKFIDIDLDEKNFVIPNIAIHLNREINEGFKYNKQTDMTPIISVMESSKVFNSNHLIYKIADKYNIDKKEILDYDLYLYQKQEPILAGLEDELILSPKLDNLQSVYISNRALIEATTNDDSLLLNIFFDNEEMGSETASGADSSLFKIFLDRLNKFYKVDEFSIYRDSFIVSCDATHAKHHSGSSLSDPTNAPVLNEGIVVKQSASGNYSTDGLSSSVVIDICKRNNIPFQFYSTRSDKRAGSTLGPVFSANTGINSVDIGVAILAMHSTVETGGVKDINYLLKFFNNFFN